MLVRLRQSGQNRWHLASVLCLLWGATVADFRWCKHAAPTAHVTQSTLTRAVSPIAWNSGNSSHSSASIPATQQWFDDLLVQKTWDCLLFLLKLCEMKFTISSWMGVLNTVSKVTILPDDSPLVEYTDINGRAHATVGRGEGHPLLRQNHNYLIWFLKYLIKTFAYKFWGECINTCLSNNISPISW